MNRPLEAARSLLIWAVAFPVFLACCLIVLSATFLTRGRHLEPIVKTCCRTVLFFCGIRIRVRGTENIVPGRQYLLMMNHVNFFDPLLFYAVYPGHARGIEEESHFRWPVYGAILKRLGVVPVDRKNPQKARASLVRAAELIRSRPDFSFLVMPEGSRSPDGRLGPFKRGGFILAVQAGLEILPLVQVGADRINRKGSRLIRPGRVDLVIAPAVPSAGFTREAHDGLMERVRAAFLRHISDGGY
jgi:1-acyl-sn-glycerol-3-phosphate acyltransferase